MSEASAPPLVSVVIRSYNRLGPLCELIEALLAQDYPRFEIVVVEQSTVTPPAAAARLAALAASDARVRVLRFPPLGGPGARNAGVAAARGDTFLFIDDDDLPASPDWIARHVAAYTDPRRLAVSGRHRYADAPEHVYSPLVDLVTRTLSFVPLLRLPVCYVRHDRPRAPVGAIHGTNASVRRSAVERFGGWDTDTTVEDEASFCLRALRRMSPGEHFAYDPGPTVLRRRDFGGGLDKRRLSAAGYFLRYLEFVHRILGRYHPIRVVLLYPLYLGALYVLSLTWTFAESKRYPGLAGRLGAALGLRPAVPFLALYGLARGIARPRAGGEVAELALAPRD
jgi:glycosyltransferase involved in cell wall biosynthesis